MSSRAPKLLYDAISAIEYASVFVGELSLAAYLVDALRRSAVERQIEILGQACARLDRLDPFWSQQIPDLRLAMGLRRRVLHGYDAVDHAMVYETLQCDLPPLRDALARALEALQSSRGM